MKVEDMGTAAATETPEAVTEAEGLSALTVAQLRGRARALGLPGCGKMVKAALVQAIEAAEAADETETTTEAPAADEATLALGRRLWAAGGYFQKRGLIGPKQEGLFKNALKEVFMAPEPLTSRELAALRICYILLGVIKRLL